MKIGTGYIYNSDTPKDKLKQIDIIIYNDTFPALFEDNGFVIVIPEIVEAIIEVKTRLDNSILRKTMKDLSYIRKKYNFNWPRSNNKTVLIGLFSYEGYRLSIG